MVDTDGRALVLPRRHRLEAIGVKRWVAMVALPMMRRLTPILVALGLAAGSPGTAAATTSQFPPGFHGYHTYDEMVAEIHDIATAHPDIVKLSVYGQSAQGRDLWMVKISDNVATDENEPEVVVSSLAHAREHMGVEQSFAVIHWLVDHYNDPGYERETAIVNSIELWVQPETNPDGGEFDIRGQRFHDWYKNRQPNAGTRKIGTDIAANYPFKWGCCGVASGNPGDQHYRGAFPFSAPESAAQRDFFKSRVIGGHQQIRLLLSIHSHAERIAYPYGYRPNVPALTRPVEGAIPA